MVAALHSFISLLSVALFDVLKAINCNGCKNYSACWKQSPLRSPELFDVLSRKKIIPPTWKHHRDHWSFKDCQPLEFSPSQLAGITKPHHMNIFWDRQGGLAVQCKRWLTTAEWQSPLTLASAEDIPRLRAITATRIQPEWEPSFLTSSLAWFRKLIEVLEFAQVPAAGVNHCIGLLQQRVPEFLPSEASIVAKMRLLRAESGPSDPGPSRPPALSGLDSALAKFFRGVRTSLARSCIALTGPVVEDLTQGIAPSPWRRA